MPWEPPKLPPEFPAPWRPTTPPPPLLPPTPVVFPDVRGPSHLDDVYERLLDQRIIVLDGVLSADSATRAAAQVMLLDATGDDPIEVYLSCPDGDLDAALGLADTFDLVGVPLRATARGTVGGPALAAYVAAGRRLSHAHARFVLRDPTVEMSGRAVDLVAQVEAHERQLESLHRRIAEECGKRPERIAEDMRAGLTLDARKAQAYGLVHEIVGHVVNSRARSRD